MLRRVIPCAVWLLVFALTACGVESAVSPNATNRIVYGLTLEPSGFDPHINRSSELGIPLRQVYDTLVYRDPATNEFVPGLASDWAISDDGRIYTFKLRQGITFHDGTAFDAQAVAFNLDRITNPEIASQRAVFMLGSYAGYEIVDDYTLRIILSEPYSPLLDSLAQVYLGIASPKALQEYSVNRYQFHQVGTGPFIFVEYIPKDRLVLRRNPNYAWGPGFYQPPTGQSINEIEFRFFTDPPTRALALESGAVQIIGELQPVDARALTGSSTIQLTPVEVPGQPLQFLMNTARFPTDSRAFRQALLFGTNRSAIIDAVYQRFSPVAWGPLSAATLYYSHEMNGLYSFDLDQAQALLDSLQYLDSDTDGIRDFAGINIQVDVIVPPWGLAPQVSELLQDQWRTLGVAANLKAVPTFTNLLEEVNSGEYNLVAFDTAGLDPSILNTFYMSGGSNNYTGFSDPNLDAVLQEAVRQTDPATRGAYYAEAQRIIMDQALLLPIRDYVNLNAASANLRGLAFDAYGWFPVVNNLSFASAS